MKDKHQPRQSHLNPKRAVLLTVVALAFGVSGAQSTDMKRQSARFLQDTAPEARPLNCSDVQPAHECHEIAMTAFALDKGQLAYAMLRHEIYEANGESRDVTDSRYHPGVPTIPGPTLVISEGDEVFLTIHNNIDKAPNEQVSVHVHGVHYAIDSDGTLTHVNGISDQGAYPAESALDPKTYTYHWTAAPGTAGTWPYHDHNFGDINGAEHKGLVGAVIVNPASGQTAATLDETVQTVDIDVIDKDYVLYLGDDAFWGMVIDNADNGRQTRGQPNPTLTASPNTLVRFHLLAVGTDFHEFELTDYRWFDPSIQALIERKAIGALEHHVFTIEATTPAQYLDRNFSNDLLGMRGEFQVGG